VIVCDTSAMLAALDRDQRLHDRARALLAADDGPFVLSPFVLGELDYFLGNRYGVDAELAVLDEVATGAYHLVAFDGSDVAEMREVVARYRDLRIGIADASIVVLAARFRTRRIFTLDRRHFDAMRPLQGGRFEVLPAA
jgi:predicted nucleic acid-binding protein